MTTPHRRYKYKVRWLDRLSCLLEGHAWTFDFINCARCGLKGPGYERFHAMPKKDVDDQFNEIIQDALAAAAKVDCAAADYRAGLRQMIDELKTALAASEEMDDD